MSAVLRKLLSPVVELRERELTTAAMMFGYSFLVMTAYTSLKPVTRSQFIRDLGADNLPFVQFAFGVLIGLIMQGYAAIVGRLPRRWALPITLGGLVALLVAFWGWFQSGSEWASTGFYFFGLILGILVISQFWTLANEVYDPRQAKRIFGFIGGGASLGGIAGSSLTLQAETIGTTNLLLVAAALMTVCLVLVVAIIRRERPEIRGSLTGGEDEGVGAGEALRLLRDSRHLQIISLIIAFAAIGAAIVEQQLNMATEAVKGQANVDSITSFLGEVQLYTSVIGFVIQVWLTSKIQRYLGIGFALLVLPASLGITGTIMLLNGALWAPALARVIDTSLRYTIDKTTREILFLPLPNELKQQAKPFIDVTVDRFAKGIGALLVLVLIKDWGLGLSWQQLSWASLTMIVLWVFAAIRAKREYQSVFRRTLERQDVAPDLLRLNEADLSTIETLVEEQGHPDPRHVNYAVDMLASLNKRHLISPLLLNHESPAVRARALSMLEGASEQVRQRWSAGVERALTDPAPEVRAAAVGALAVVRGGEAAALMRPHLQARDPRLVVTAAAALASSPQDADREAARSTLERMSADMRPGAADARREVAQALGTIGNPEFRRLLIPLMYDPQREVALEAIRSAGRLGGDDYIFVPPLVSLLRNRLLKQAAREVLVGYGPGVVPALAYFMRDQDEDVWVRRHLPTTLAQIPSQASADALVAALDDPDGFLRFKAISALLRLKQSHPGLAIPSEAVQRLLVRESNRYLSYLSLRYNLVREDPTAADTLLARALGEKLARTLDRVYRLLGLLYDWKDVSAARWSLEHGDARMKASAAEYLDTMLDGPVRRHVMPILEDLPIEEKVRRGNNLLKTRIRDSEDSLAQLVHDEDQIVAATAIQFVERRGLWSLAGDLEYALEHRNPGDWYVFEAASWALAARRLSPAERQRRWLEPLPAVEIADRIASLPLFLLAPVDDLFRIAGTGRQVRHERGRLIYEAGRRSTEFQFLLDGTVSRFQPSGDSTGQDAETVTAPAALGFDDVFEGVPQRATVKSDGTAICLSLLDEQFLGLLSDNEDLAQGVFRMLLDTHGGEAWARVVRGVIHPPSPERLRDGLQLIDKVIVIEEVPVFSRASSEQLAVLAAAAREIRLTEGQVLFEAGDAPSLYLILDGELTLEPMTGGDPMVAGPGDAAGVYETLGGYASTGWKGHVTRSGVALRIDREALFDVLTDHVDLLQGLFSALQRQSPRALTPAG
ncbi:MAG TPA: Npt1/Npt2 family nucleotide transporter [Vicinamibacterales bacterium]